MLTSPVACPVCPGLAVLAVPAEESPHGVASSPFLQEAEGFEGRVKGASILTSDEFCTRPPPPTSFQYKESSTMLGTFFGG